MPYTYQFDLAVRRVRIHVTGVDTAGELMGRMERITSDPRWQPGLDVLADFSDAEEFNPTTDELHTIADLHASLDERIGGGRLAIVARQDVTYGLSRMFQAFAEPKISVEVGVFRELAEAESWLARGPGAPDGELVGAA